MSNVISACNLRLSQLLESVHNLPIDKLAAMRELSLARFEPSSARQPSFDTEARAHKQSEGITDLHGQGARQESDEPHCRALHVEACATACGEAGYRG